MYSGIDGTDRQRARIQCAEYRSLWHAQQLGRQPRLGHRRDTLGGHRWRNTNIELQPERRGEFILKKLAQRAISGIGAPDEFALIPTQAEGMVAMARSRFPQRPLAGQDRGQGILIRQDLGGQWLLNHCEASLVPKQLANSDALFALLGQLWPVASYGSLVIEGAARGRQSPRQRREALGG